MPNVAKLILTAVTSKKDSAGTDANIYLVFNGGPKMIWVPADKGSFEKGKTDRVEWDVERFGIDWDGIQKVEIFNDSSGEGPGWFIDKLMVEAVLADGRAAKLAETADGFGWLDRTEKEGDRRALPLTKG